VKKGAVAVTTSGFFLTALLLASGCKRSALSKEELDAGRTAIETGLQAWQKGEKPDALQKLNPPISFRDDDWRRGMRLTTWEITYTNGSAGDLTPRCEVVLSLLDRKGNKINRRVVYSVEKGETISVVRDPYF
jgi:hypothetical protein